MLSTSVKAGKKVATTSVHKLVRQQVKVAGAQKHPHTGLVSLLVKGDSKK